MATHSFGQQPSSVDAMDAASFAVPEGKARVEVVEGKAGKALQFSFPEGARNVFATRKAPTNPEWDKAAGLSFWVKGDGSASLGGLQLIWNEDYGIRYDYAFPINHTGWKKIVVPWSDFVPVLPTPGSRPLGAPAGNAPSKISQIWVGKWWYWRDYPAHSFAIDEIRLEPVIPRDVTPKGKPLERVLAKLKAGEPITVITMGDSLTDYAHWSNKPVNWPTLLKKAIRERFKSEVTIVNPAIGGTQLRHNLVLLPRWTAATPTPDLVTVFFGGNDWDAGMRGPMFLDAQMDAVERIRRVTDGKTDVLLMTTAPAVEKWETTAELADAVRKAAHETNAGLADTQRALHAAGVNNREQLFSSDKVHLGPAGHKVIAETVLRALEDGGRQP